MYTCSSIEVNGALQKIHIYSYVRQLIFLRKSDCLGCAVLLCLVVCMTLLSSFFLPSASLIDMYTFHRALLMIWTWRMI